MACGSTELGLRIGMLTLPTLETLNGPSPIDWCEDNNGHANFLSVKEFNNTWTNIFYVLVGIVLLFMHFDKSNTSNWLFLSYGVNSIMTGIASAYFHATLNFKGQKIDEFFENVTLISLLYFNLGYGFGRLIVHSLLLGVGVFCVPCVFCEVHLASTVLASFAAANSKLKCLNKANDYMKKEVVKQFTLALVFASSGFALWIVDFAWCSPLIKKMNLHAFAWHLFTAIAILYGGKGSMLLNTLTKDEKSKV